MIQNETKGLPLGWQRAETLSGVPYYISHASETTQWDHPQMTMLMREMSSADDIRYAAYRTAMKLRAIEKKIQLDSINLTTIRAVFNDLGYPEMFTENEISVQQLEEILTDIFARQRDKGGDVNVVIGVELVLNWLLNVYDQTRSGSVRILSAKVGLACLSVASVQEKYKYIFDQVSSTKGFIDKKRLRVVLKDALQILKYIKEYQSFGRSGVEPTVNSCFDRAFIPERIGVQEFLDWMIDEPQTLVWLPTLHRLAMSETVKHEGKCNICKMFPIVGFRYRCLKCFNFDMCQNCFWSGRVAKNHKLRHQTQEYCLPATQKEDIKDFTKVIKSKIRKKKKKAPTRVRYLPISSDAVRSAQASDEDTDFVDYADNESTTSFESNDVDSERFSDTKRILTSHTRHSSSEFMASTPDILNDKSAQTTSSPTAARLDRGQVKEMEQIVEGLEEDNRYLREKILDLQDIETRRHLTQSDERVAITEYNERLEARQEVLEDHNRRLEHQLRKLRQLIHQKTTTLPTNSLTDRNDLINNRLKSIDYSPDSTSVRQQTRSSPYSYEKLRPCRKLPEKTGESGSNSFRRPPFKPLLRPSFVPENAVVEPEKESGSSNDIHGPSTSMSSDEDLRAIEVRLEELLDSPTEAGREPWSRSESQTALPVYADSNSSDEQQKYLLTAASMVGEAMDDLVSSLSHDQQSSWKHLELDFSEDDEDV